MKDIAQNEDEFSSYQEDIAKRKSEEDMDEREL